VRSHLVKKDLGFFSATTLVIANMIGTGIFTSSGFIVRELGNPWAMVLCWLVGGIFALSGAICYGELGAMFPRAGGEYVFLRESLGRWMAFLSGWISLIVGFSAPIAAAAIGFSAYLAGALPGQLGLKIAEPLLKSDLFIITPVTLLASTIIAVFSMLHQHSLLLGSRVQNALTAFKVLLIMGFIAAGVFFGNGATWHFQGLPSGHLIFSDSFAVSLVFVSFAYSGWNAAAYLGSEIRNPRKNIPLALVCGTSFVMFLYLLLNLLYIYALPMNEMSGVVEVGAKAALALFGERASYWISGAVAVALSSVISAMIMAGPRVYYAMAADGVFFRIFAQLRSTYGTPSYSVFLQGGIAVLMVITASFEKLLFYIGFTISLFAMLTVVGLMVLRAKGAERIGRYRSLGYPITPMVFIGGNLWIIYFSIRSKPVVSLWGLATVAVGSLAYFLFTLWRRSSSRMPDS
jgi:APA family basic amino acid/polyamine antiporter